MNCHEFNDWIVKVHLQAIFTYLTFDITIRNYRMFYLSFCGLEFVDKGNCSSASGALCPASLVMCSLLHKN
jgi:hypothetical protein